MALLPLKVGLDMGRPGELFEERLGEDLVERDVELLAPRDGNPLMKADAEVRCQEERTTQGSIERNA